MLVLWFDITHIYTQHTQWPIDWHSYINIYQHNLLCAHSSYLYYSELIIFWYQKFTFHNIFAFQKLLTCKVIYLLIRYNKTKFCLCDVKNSDRCGINKQYTHTCSSNTQRKITLERVSMKVSDIPCFTDPSLFKGKIWTPHFFTKILKRGRGFSYDGVTNPFEVACDSWEKIAPKNEGIGSKMGKIGQMFGH